LGCRLASCHQLYVERSSNFKNSAWHRFRAIDGQIETLSEDAVQDENVGLVYTAQILLEKSTLNVEGKTVPLSPGMAVTVEAKTGKRRLIEFLLSPLLRFKQESARER
jgi:hemolysin D